MRKVTRRALRGVGPRSCWTLLLRMKNLVSLALVVDIWLAARDWVHARDQRKRGTFGSICIAKRLNSAFLKDLHALIEQENPLALAKGTKPEQVEFLLLGRCMSFLSRGSVPHAAQAAVPPREDTAS